jgi:dTDP-4-amino-4,6-dideoxygalactose transaminase
MDLLESAAREGTSPSRTSGRVVAILVAQLYGRRGDMSGAVAVARKYNLQLIEDLAETFSSLSHIGAPEADLAFLSFGSIKIATAFGGGVARVKDAQVWRIMRDAQSKWSVQARSTFFNKVRTKTNNSSPHQRTSRCSYLFLAFFFLFSCSLLLPSVRRTLSRCLR